MRKRAKTFRTFCVRFPDKCKEMSEKLNLSVDQVDHAASHYFDSIERSMENPTMPNIYLKKFAWFRPSIEVVLRRITRSFRNYHLGKITTEQMQNVIRKLWPIYKRLQKEDRSHSARDVGLSTDEFYEWRDKFMEAEGMKLDPRGRPRKQSNK
jgi:hypothetical protein